MSSTNNDVEWVETTEVVITDDGPPSETHLAGMLKLRDHLLIWGCGLVTLETDKHFLLQRYRIWSR